MSPNTTGWNELHLAENPAVELLESLDYTYLPPEALEGERKSSKETILTSRLAEALKRLNPWLSETNVAKAVKTVAHVACSQSRGGERESSYVAHLRHRAGAGPGRRTEKPYSPVLRLRSA